MQGRVLCLSFPVLSARGGLGPYKIIKPVYTLNRIGGLLALAHDLVHAVWSADIMPSRRRDFLLAGYPL